LSGHFPTAAWWDGWELGIEELREFGLECVNAFLDVGCATEVGGRDSE
jgi:hypothetical protein